MKPLPYIHTYPEKQLLLRYYTSNINNTKSMNSLSLQVHAMNGGDGPRSYIKNSAYQRGALDVAKTIIEEEIAKNFDTEHVDSVFRIADFGCSTGHNSFPAIQIIIDAIKKKHKHSSGLTLEFRVVFNDVVTNDFNTLLVSLPPHRDYYAVVVPGDFHGRLMPPSSLHFAYSSWSLQWLKEAPKAMANRDSPAWNKGRILYSGDRKEVCDAYLQQFEEDMEEFLEARGVEIMEGGLMAFLIPGVPTCWNPETECTILSITNILGSCLVEMAKKGRFSEEKIDSFNIPFYTPTTENLKVILQRSKTFSIQRMEIIDNPGKYTSRTAEGRVATLRAVYEDLLDRHFGAEIIDELFELYVKKLAALPFFIGPENDRNIVILVVLKRV